MKNPRNDKITKMVILEADDAANVVGITPEQEMVFVKQYRFGIGQYMLELPGGIIDKGETHENAAIREFSEETGYAGKDWQFLGSIASNPVFLNSYIYHWLATDVILSTPLNLDEAEDIHLEIIPVPRVKEMLFKGEFQHPHTVNALMLYFANYTI